MLAYHNDPALKAKLLADLQVHADADQLVKGQYWEDGKGSAVGCTLHSLGATKTDNYAEYHKCRIKVDSWIEWYDSQRKIFESVK